MPSRVCFYFKVHQPHRLRRYGLFDIGHSRGIPHLKHFGAMYAVSNPELVDNTKVQSQWQEFECVNHKRRRAYRKELA